MDQFLTTIHTNGSSLLSILYPHDGSAAPVTNAIQKTQLTGLGGPGAPHAVSLSKDMLGNTTISRTFVDPATRTVTQTTLYPDSTNAATQVSVNGLAQYSISKTGVRTDYGYDALARQISVRVDAASPPRYVCSVTHYNSLGQVDWVADALSNRTTFVYDPTTGRRIAVTDALSNTTYTAYDPEGRVIATWGATYPVAYAYDAYGRMVGMGTYRGTNEISAFQDFSFSAFDKTQWRYDEATGLLTNKVYADGKGPSYSYTPQGQLATRTWARGVRTTYSYTNTTGELIGIDYSDATPDVTFAFNRIGQTITITDGTGTRAFAYNDALQLAAETNAFGVLVRAYDGLGRSAGFSLFNPVNHVNPVQSIAYGYSALGRFTSLSSIVGGRSNAWAYAYLPSSDLISSWTESTSGANLSHMYEAHRDLLAGVSNSVGQTMISRFGYINDALARRTQRIDSGSATATNAFGYNPRSELTSAAMGTNAYGYTYDAIGNRQFATNNVEALTYTANALNQYTNITAGTVQVPQYDLDGNLTNYNGWTYAWDAENRLISSEQVGTAVPAVRFAYDYMSRRVQMIVGSSTNTFLYDDWAMIQETTGTQTNSYIYGLDLSGSMQGAGTIGGILCANLNGTQAFYFYDANGNVTDLIDTNGVSLAHYEWDPYGNATVSSGSLASANPFRYSTKYADDETGMLYYGFRYYAPMLGRWLSRDPIGEAGGLALYAFVLNNPPKNVDPLGLKVVASCPLHDYLIKYLTAYTGLNTAGYLNGVSNGSDELRALILIRMFRSKQTFKVKGTDEASCLKNIKDHVDTRVRIIQNAKNKKYGFGAGSAFHENFTVPGLDYTVDPQAYFNSINNAQTMIACMWATKLTFYAAIGKWEQDAATRTVDVWIPGDFGYILNTAHNETEWQEGLEGENIIHFGVQNGKDVFWGHISKTPGQLTILALQQWSNFIKGWKSNDGKKSGSPQIDPEATYPTVGLE